VSLVNFLYGIPSSVVGFSPSLHDIFKKKVPVSMFITIHYVTVILFVTWVLLHLVFVFHRTARNC